MHLHAKFGDSHFSRSGITGIKIENGTCDPDQTMPLLIMVCHPKAIQYLAKRLAGENVSEMTCFV